MESTEGKSEIKKKGKKKSKKDKMEAQPNDLSPNELSPNEPKPIAALLPVDVPNYPVPPSDTVIDDLNFDCLVHLLQCLTINEAIHLRSVSPRWNDAMIIWCNTVTSLKIFFRREDLDLYRDRAELHQLGDKEEFALESAEEKDVVLFMKEDRHFKPKALVSLLTRLFPSVHTLMIFYNRSLGECLTFHVRFKQLMRYWTTLKCLTLFGLSNKHQVARRIWDDIALCPSIRRLHLFDLHNYIVRPAVFPILNQLERFTLVNYNGPMGGVLRQLGPNLKQLGLHWVYLNAQMLQLTVDNCPALRANLENLAIGYIRPEPCLSIHELMRTRKLNLSALLEVICDNFRGLTSLDISFASSLELYDMIPELAKLTKLSSIKLNTNEITEHQQAGIFRLAKLESVQSLHFEGFHADAFFHWMVHHTFPNVAEITIVANDGWHMDGIQRLMGQFHRHAESVRTDNVLKIVFT